jgi:hypothetical protein
MKSDSRKVTAVVQNAPQRMLRSAVASSPFTDRMKATPRSGRKVTTERMGQPDISVRPRT